MGWKKEVATSFLSQSHSLSFRASLRGRIAAANKGLLGTTQKCRGNNIVPGPFPTPKNGLRTKLGTKAKVSAGQRFHNGTFPILSVLNRYWLLFRLKGNSAKLSRQLQFKTAITLMHASKIQTESHAFLCLMSTSSSAC